MWSLTTLLMLLFALGLWRLMLGFVDWQVHAEHHRTFKRKHGREPLKELERECFTCYKRYYNY